MPESSRLVVVDRAALSMAGLAYIESPGPTAHRRVEDAIAAYLYLVRNVRPVGAMEVFPSLDEVRSFLTEYRAQRDAPADPSIDPRRAGERTNVTETLNQLQISGASDDLVEISGYLTTEFDAYTPATLVVSTLAGERLWVSVAWDLPPLRGIGQGWSISVMHADPAWTYPVRFGSHPTMPDNPAVVLDVPDGTTVEKWTAGPW